MSAMQVPIRPANLKVGDRVVLELENPSTKVVMRDVVAVVRETRPHDVIYKGSTYGGVLVRLKFLKSKDFEANGSPQVFLFCVKYDAYQVSDMPYQCELQAAKFQNKKYYIDSQQGYMKVHSVRHEKRDNVGMVKKVRSAAVGGGGRHANYERSNVNEVARARPGPVRRSAHESDVQPAGPHGAYCFNNESYVTLEKWSDMSPEDRADMVTLVPEGRADKGFCYTRANLVQMLSMNVRKVGGSDYYREPTLGYLFTATAFRNLKKGKGRQYHMTSAGKISKDRGRTQTPAFDLTAADADAPKPSPVARTDTIDDLYASKGGHNLRNRKPVTYY